MFDNLIQNIEENPRLKKRLSLLVGIGMILFLIFSFWPNKKYDQYQITDTGLIDKLNFGYLQGGSLYSYNGHSFISTDLKSGQQKILNTGSKLPVPEKVFWADSKGALISFKSSFYYSQVEEKLRDMKERINGSTRLYTWYLDFATNNLTLASKLPMRSTLAIYSPKDNGFYYINDDSSLDSESVDETAGEQLNFYNIQSGQTKIVSKSIAVKGIKSLNYCPDSQKDASICLTGLDPNDTRTEKLYKVDNSGAVSKLLDSKGILIPTYSQNQYLTIEQGSSKGQDLEGADTFGPGLLLNMSDGSSSKLGFDIAGSGSAFWQDPTTGKFVILDNHFSGRIVKKNTPYYYRSGSIHGSKIKSAQYKASLDGKNFDSLFINNSGYSKNGDILINSYDGNQMLIHKIEDGSKVGVSQVQSDNIKDSILECKGTSHSGDIDYFKDSRTFRVYFNDTSSLKYEIKDFADCFANKNISLLSYNFNYFIKEASSGRIVSD